MNCANKKLYHSREGGNPDLLNRKVHSKKKRGMTLIEVMCAILIMALVIIPFLDSINSSFDRSVSSNNMMMASVIGQELVGKAKSDLEFFRAIPDAIGEPETKEVEDHKGYFYSITREEVEIPVPGTGQTVKVPGLYKIRVQVLFITTNPDVPDVIVIELFFQIPEKWKDKVK